MAAVRSATHGLEQRAAARASKDWKEADRLRDALHEKGWEMRDQAGDYELAKL